MSSAFRVSTSGFGRVRCGLGAQDSGAWAEGFVQIVEMDRFLTALNSKRTQKKSTFVAWVCEAGDTTPVED